jgi:hypothetical protein
MSGQCSTLFPTLPFGDGTISETGSLGNTTVNGIQLASCNGVYNAVASGGFFGKAFQFSWLYTPVSGGCVNQLGSMTISGNLSR